ncbi:MAG: sugar phosphate isomerase/epimerase [Oscillospiraceae bacterium]|nr:sugar phosphate isomerase/epimerase [Oscillospiraceae bacterium]
MFKKAVISDEISQDLQVACDLAKKYGFDGLEIRSVWDKGPHKLSDEDIAKIREIMDANGLEVCGISAPFLKCDIMNEAEVAEQFDVVLARCMVLAKGVGTSYIRGFTGWKKGELSDALPRITELLRRASEILAKENMTLLIEMDPSVYAYDAKSIAEVVKSVACDNICALFDPGNLMWNQNPEVPYPDAYETLKPYIRHVHIKDAYQKEDGEAVCVKVGTGSVDFPGLFARLKADGYEGYVVLETHYRLKKEISEELLALPGGAEFSDGAFEASDESMAAINEMLAKI